MRIQNNIPALNTFRQMGVNTMGTAKSLEKLSSGFRVNRAGDDAAGLAISEKMRAQVRGLNRASSNAQDGISLIQAAEGALQETHAILQRMRVLSIQGANDINETIDRQAIQDEINQLTKEIDRIANTTEFNKKSVLDGSLQNGKFIKNVSGFNVSSLGIIAQADDDNNSTILNSLTSIAVTQAGIKYDMSFDFALITDTEEGIVQNALTTDLVAGTIINITLNDQMLIALGLPDDENTLQVAVNPNESGAIIAGNVRTLLQERLGADWTVTATGSKLNVIHNFVGEMGDDAITFELSGAEVFANDVTELTEVNGGRDVIVSLNGGEEGDSELAFGEGNFIFEETSSIGENTIALRGRDSIALLRVSNADFEESTVAFQFKIDDATRLSGAIISIAQGEELSLQVGANTGYTQTIKLGIVSHSATAMGISMLNVLTHADAQNAVDSVDGALQMVSNQRAALGAIQNRLEHTIANLDTVSENLQDAEARIRDVDMAKEMMNFTKFTILTQASQAMMAQANNLPQGVLQLLR